MKIPRNIPFEKKITKKLPLFWNGNGIESDYRGVAKTFALPKNGRKISQIFNNDFCLLLLTFMLIIYLFYGQHTGVQDSYLVTFFGIESRSRF
jgi:hypothetical protein